MRIVYDASAKISSTALSLNDCLHTGPDLIQGLQNILLTFRSHKIAFTADIEKAFLQMGAMSSTGHEIQSFFTSYLVLHFSEVWKCGKVRQSKDIGALFPHS